MSATLREPNAAPSPGPNGHAAQDAAARALLDRRAAAETARVLAAELEARLAGEVRFDRVSRMLYATDASNYQIEPVGVVLPKTTEDVLATVELASSHGVPLLPRGGGSSLAGQAVGAALVIDFSKYLSRVLAVDPEARVVTVEPGIAIAGLNRLLKPHGLMFGPDPASADRATAGGVVGNNGTGSHSILYGMTSDNVRAARAALHDGSVVDLAPATPASPNALADRAAGDDPTGRLLAKLLAFRATHRDLIARDFPPHWRRATGYSLDQFLKPDNAFNPARLLVSSEGTLATTLQLTLDLVPTPKRTGLVLLQFDDLVAAMAATPTILETEPSAVELMDRMLVGLTRAQPGFARQLAFVEGDPAAILVVEFYGESEAELERKAAGLESHLAAARVRLSAAPQRVLDAKRQADVWAVRKAGLGLLMSVKGDHKPVPVIEDVSVPVPHLAEYVGAVEAMVAGHGTTAAFYAHASAGCLHVRPLLNLKTVEGVSAMRELAHAAAELARRFGGVMSGEHGDGLQRSELNPTIFGPELYAAMREFKALWDPRGLMNPGKIVDAPPLTEHLRYGPAYAPREPKTYLDFSAEGGFLRAAEMCNGAAVCRKLKAGTMCPSYMATKDEKDTTRGRANALRNALAGQALERSDLTSKGTYDVLDLCLSCKACKTECPSSVDMAKLKVEFLAHYQAKHGTPLRSRVFGHIHTISRLTAPVAPLANLALKTPLAKPAMRALGVHPDRVLSPFARRTFVARWRAHRRRHQETARQTRGKVVYFHDTFATYNYPRIGMAAVKLLEAAGFEVVVEERRACCGRPMLSKGLVGEARKAARRNVALLAPYAKQGIPIVGTEPSCILTLRDEYKDLLPDDPDVAAVAAESFMIDEFLAKLDAAGDLNIAWKEGPGPDVFFHGHCHQKALIGIGPSLAVLKAAGCTATESGAGCCGMAGSFGYEAEHFDVSRKIGEERLFPAVAAAPAETAIAVAGVSCRQQIEHFTDRGTRHIAEVLAGRIAPGHAAPDHAPEPVPAGVTPTPELTAHARNTPEGPA
ncbi:MAG: Fe-S protein, homolog of lactate dehydrogenase SO1521 [uncultured Thermomicrobiales bacterium]|uniref:Fe-S protein, homolog of lactate dehydrogenase SO1521 n=1 Tax=uncultured Thermomicrobiales bacterium TaxID=1645740 RepID=A0A6J4VAU6_9BACT|nr:MAG: Fe-S protein, homolog of lactate dehydrogenase SO1521 [uncultured Thermomicrobiales bacterium]